MIKFSIYVQWLFLFAFPVAALPLNSADKTLVRKARIAHQKINELNGAVDSEDIVNILDLLEDDEFIIDDFNLVLAEYRMQNWGQLISEYVANMQVIYSFHSLSFQEKHRNIFESAVDDLMQVRSLINEKIKMIHPGFSHLNMTHLTSLYDGEGQAIVVFDLFDEELLKRQVGYYEKNSRIEPVKSFGNPVAMSHGNSVIDVILSIAPRVTIVPVSADAKGYLAALRYIRGLADVKIVNMSRAFLEKDHALDPAFGRLLSSILSEKVICKSLGNSGIDLDGNLSSIRKEKGLSEVGDVFSYDSYLIKQYLHENYEHPWLDHLFLAINYNLLAEQPSLTATIPGDYIPAQEHSLAVVADGIFTWSSNGYESGSSFAAPQICSIFALLQQALSANGQGFDLNSNEALRTISRSLKSKAVKTGQKPTIEGRGLISADRAFYDLWNRRLK